jgi:hypothetical protein
VGLLHRGSRRLGAFYPFDVFDVFDVFLRLTVRA